MEINIYHYLFDLSEKDKILKTKKLLPINILKDPKIVKIYSEMAIKNKLDGSSENNTDIENAELQWKYTYNKLYKNVLNKPYKNYGIYTTIVDLFSFDSGVKYRFKLSYNDIKDKESVIQVGGKVKIIKSIQDIIDVNKIYYNNKLVERIWNKSKFFKFKRLPQIVVFSNYINVNESMLETKKG